MITADFCESNCKLETRSLEQMRADTPEGQAKFFKVMIPRLHEKKFMAGSIVYCWADSDSCYMCGQHDCPTETRWGLVDRFANPKPSFYAVREAFGKIRGKS